MAEEEGFETPGTFRYSGFQVGSGSRLLPTLLNRFHRQSILADGDPAAVGSRPRLFTDKTRTASLPSVPGEVVAAQGEPEVDAVAACGVDGFRCRRVADRRQTGGLPERDGGGAVVGHENALAV